jgi:uncharacterized membrane protein YfcA
VPSNHHPISSSSQKKSSEELHAPPKNQAGQWMVESQWTHFDWKRNWMAVAGIGFLFFLVIVELFFVPSVPTMEEGAGQFDNITLQTGTRLLILGMLTGLVGGLLGMGGGVLKSSGLIIIFGLEMMIVRAVALISNVFIYGSALQRYRKDDLVIKDVVTNMVPGAIVGIVIGFTIGNNVNQLVLKRFLGLFALLVSIQMLHQIYLAKKAEYQAALEDLPVPDFNTPKQRLRLAGIGAPMGFVMGLLGISGGVLAVPLQHFVMKIPFKQAIANSSAAAVTASTIAMIMTIIHGHSQGHFHFMAPILMSLWIIPGTIIGAQLGARLTKMLALDFLKIIYAVLMFAIAMRLSF